MVRLLVALCLVAGGFAWGGYVHRNRVFPYQLLREVAWATGWIEPSRETMAPRSRRTAQDRLKTLGYLQTTPVAPGDNRTGVVLNNREKTAAGVNFYKEVSSTDAVLIDNDGVELHKWIFDPGSSVEWIHAELLPEDGTIIGILKDDSVFRLSVDSEVEWRTPVGAHHDLQVREDGSIWVLTRNNARWPERYGEQTIIEDPVTVLSASGEVQERFSLVAPFKESPFAYLMPAIGQPEFDAAFDILHANHVEVFDGRPADQSPLYREGNVLVSFRTINTIAILAHDTQEILWLWGPTNVAVQHHPRLLENGRILLFDNGFEESRILEIGMPQGNILWSYSDGLDFHSSWGGTAHRLANGNTLITDSAAGEAFEVTSDGKVVWRFVNSRIDDGTLPPMETAATGRWNIWRMTRYQPEELPFLNSVSSR